MAPTSTPTQVAVATPETLSLLRDFENGRWLEETAPELASSIKELNWIRDSIDRAEAEVIQDLLYVAVASRSVASSIVALDWVQDGIDSLEAGAIDWMSNIASVEVMSTIVALGWVQDGIGEVDVETIENLSYIANADTEVGLAVVFLDWIQDGVVDSEAEVTEDLSYIAFEHVEVAEAVVAMDWVRDGISSFEGEVIEEISYLSHEHAATALSVVGMPFMETIEPPDISAVASLWQLVADNPGTFDAVMSHEALRDGISDDLAPVVATLHGVAETNPVLINVLLDPSKVLLERRTITLPLSGDVTLDIIRTAPGASSSMDLLEDSVRRIEGYMGMPFPTSYVGLLYGHGYSGGKNFGTHIAIDLGADIDDENESDRTIIAHEVAHYYWSGNKRWVDEGGANFLEIERHFTGTSQDATASVSDPPCGYATSIVEFENLDEDIETVCEYSLGERLFVDLYLTLGDERFREGFRTLYLLSELESVGVEQVREAFRSDDRAVRTVISRWYDGTETYDLSRLDSGAVDPTLPSINGRIDDAFIVTSTDGPAVSGFSAQDVTGWVYLTFESSYSVSGGPHEVLMEIVEYYEDGFMFSRRSAKLTAEDQYIGGTALFAVGSPPSQRWAPGHYGVYVYVGERKVAEVEYEVTP